MRRILFIFIVLTISTFIAACREEPGSSEDSQYLSGSADEEIETAAPAYDSTDAATTIQEVEVTRIVESVVEVPGDERRTLVFESQLFSPEKEQEFFINEIIKPFEDALNVTISFQVLDDDMLLDRARIQQETSHVTTDLVVVHNSRFSDWLNLGYVEDLTELVGSWGDRNFVSAFNSYTHRDGRQYFIPIGADVYLLLANNQAIKYLPPGSQVESMSWDEYAVWANAIAEGHGSGKVCVTGVPQRSWAYMFGAAALSYGAEFPNINSPEAGQAWMIWNSMGESLIPSVLSTENCVEPMTSGEAWLTVFHSARAGQVLTSNPDGYTVAPAPSGPFGIGSIAGATGYAIMKGTSNYDLALEFLEYLTRPEIQVKIARGTGGFIPAVIEAAEYAGDDPIDVVIKNAVLTLERGIVSGVPAADYTNWDSVKQIYDDIFATMVLSGGGVLDQTLLDQGQEVLISLER